MDGAAVVGGGIARSRDWVFISSFVSAFASVGVGDVSEGSVKIGESFVHLKIIPEGSGERTLLDWHLMIKQLTNLLKQS